jgi:hypothetical protein
MILVQDIIDRITSALDAEGFQTYDFLRDFKFAISYAVEYCCSILDPVLGKNRFTDERLSDLRYTRTWKTNNRSSFVFDETEVKQKLWGIVVIYIDPVITPNTPIVQTDPATSVYSPTHKYIKSYKSCFRGNSQEVPQSRRGFFTPGSERYTNCPDLIEYAYLSPSHFGNAYNTDPDSKEIFIAPDYNNKVVSMEYVAYPTLVTSPTQQIEFPASMFNMIVEKSLYFLGMKRGDTNIQVSSENDLKQQENFIK